MAPTPPPPDSSTYFRKGFGLKAEVQEELAAYEGALVDRMKASDYTLMVGDVTIRLARAFGFSSIQPADVVILPAFGVTIEDFEELRSLGCILVDTTCGSVLNVWKRVESYARDGFTSVIHGKHFHEETKATASQVTKHAG